MLLDYERDLNDRRFLESLRELVEESLPDVRRISIENKRDVFRDEITDRKVVIDFLNGKQIRVKTSPDASKIELGYLVFRELRKNEKRF